MEKRAAELTGISLHSAVTEFLPDVPTAAARIVRSGDLPDIIGGAELRPLFNLFGPQGAFVQLDTLIPEHAPPEGEDPRFYGWWGDMEFAEHLLKVLRQKRQGSVEVIFHPPLAACAAAGRKELAALCEAAVRDGMPIAATSSL